MGTPPYYYGRRGDNERPRPPTECPFREFFLRCRCDSYAVRLVASFSDETGEMELALVCSHCNTREKVVAK